jgi:hypothetical protein
MNFISFNTDSCCILLSEIHEVIEGSGIAWAVQGLNRILDQTIVELWWGV